MKKYAINGLSASGTGPQTAFSLGSAGSADARPLISEITFGVRTNPNATDQQVEFAVGTLTGLGTSTAKTPKPLDFYDPVTPIVVGGIAHSGEPTYAATYWIDTDMNQRGLFRWVAETGFELGSSTSANTVGSGGKMVGVTAAVVMSMPVHYKE